MNWAKAIVGVVLVLWSSTAWSATLTWNANKEPDMAGYRVYQCSQQPCTRASGHASLLVTLGKTTSFNIGTPVVTHYYFITAYDLANKESGSSNVATFTPGVSTAPPPPPPLLVLSSSTAGGATLTWNANSDPDLWGYRVYQCSQQPCTLASGHASLLARFGKTTSYNIGTPTVTHYYFITAYDHTNKESGSSNVATFTPNAPPPPPLLVLSLSTAGSATLTWNANSDPDLLGYHVYHCSQQPCTPASGHASLLVTLGKTTSFNIGTPAVTHYYFITAYDHTNKESGSSNVATFTPGVSTAPPPPPPHLVLSSIAGGATLTWNANSDPDLCGLSRLSM